MVPTTRTSFAAATALAAMVALAAPVGAQRREGGQQERQGSAAPRGAERPGPSEPRARQQAPRPAARQTAPRVNRDPSPSESPRQNSRPSVQTPSPRQAPSPRQGPAPRQGPSTRQGPSSRSGVYDGDSRYESDARRPQAVARPRATPPPNVYRNSPSARYGSNSSPSYRGPRPSVQRWAPYGYRSYNPGRRSIFSTPYYSFRPRLSLGFGISVGYGVAYPFRYYDPYGPYNYRIRPVPGYSSGYSSYYSRVGGISFDIYPYDAALFIDGEYVGVAGEFTPDQMPLTLPVGRHRIDLRADGFMTASFDITIVGGQVIPYQGSLADVGY